MRLALSAAGCLLTLSLASPALAGDAGLGVASLPADEIAAKGHAGLKVGAASLSGLAAISDPNSDGDKLAVQKIKADSGDYVTKRLVVIDRLGRIKREETLPEWRNVTVPAEEAWLTADNYHEAEALKKATGPVAVDAWGREMLVSGNGEYYATVIEAGFWYEFEYKDRHGRGLWRARPDGNHLFRKAVISYDGAEVAIVDEGGVGDADSWQPTERHVYLYDNTGRLIKKEVLKDKAD
jgi:hypothetical protein